jgi:histidine triad (HIT) family protein
VSEAAAPACAFCSIARGDEPGWIVLEDEHSVAFLDRRPLFPGHALLVPRVHVETLLELPSELVAPYFAAAQVLATAVQRGCEANGVFVAINNRVSQSVGHLHVHVVPRRKGDGLRGFFWPRTRYRGPEHMEQVGEAIRVEVAALRAGRDGGDPP